MTLNKETYYKWQELRSKVGKFNDKKKEGEEGISGKKKRENRC